MMQIEKTTDMVWIAPEDVDRYWHLQPAETHDDHRVKGTDPHTLRRQRIRRAQYAAVGAVHWKP